VPLTDHKSDCGDICPCKASGASDIHGFSAATETPTQRELNDSFQAQKKQPAIWGFRMGVFISLFFPQNPLKKYKKY